MGLILFSLCIGLGFRYPSSKQVTWGILLFMLFYFSFVERDGDYQQYKYVYERFDSSWLTAYEPGFVGILWLCKQLGLSYSLFRLVVGSLFLGGLYRALRMQTKHTAFVLGLILIFPFFCFVAVIRSALAMAVILNVIPFLQDRSCKSTLRYIAGIGLAALFHYSSLLFLALLLVHIPMTRKTLALYAGLSLLAGLILHFTDWIYRALRLVTDNQKILGWFTDNASKANLTGAAAILILFGVFAATAWLVPRWTQALPAGQKDYGILTGRIGILLCFAYPLFVYSSVFTRQLYLLLPCVILSCANAAFSGTCPRQITVGPIRIPFPVAAALATVVIFALYYDWPYWKQGLSMYAGLLSFPQIR